MNIRVEIDKGSGFCAGVIRAIGKAEEYLDGHFGGELFSLGPIVHNESELVRLAGKGLKCIAVSDIDGIDASSSQVSLLVRAHGEPPSTYEKAREKGYSIIDCTCPVVLRLQNRIRAAYERLSPRNGKIIIFGEIGHAEILGLIGQVGGDAVIVENIGMLRDFILDGTIKTDAPTEIFSQTTKDPEEYRELCVEAARLISELVVHDTICSQVSSRHSKLLSFSKAHDVIVFVAGRQSSNGKVLSNLCKSANGRTYIVGGLDELQADWFREGDSVGICGATSTPKWLLEEVAGAIENLQ